MKKKSSIRISAMNYLAIREYSVQGMGTKLLKKYGQCEENTIVQIIQQLVDENLLSDIRYTETLIQTRFTKGYGRFRILYELQAKGIDKSLSEDYLSEISEEQWLEKLEQQRIKKYGHKIPEDLSGKQKQARFLYQRGYLMEQIKTVLEIK